MKKSKKSKRKALLPYFSLDTQYEAGCDEAGRGCLAGPVTAAAVILPRDFSHPLLNDSKQLTEAARQELRPIIEREAIAYEVAFVSHTEIDKYNILRSSFIAMHRAIDKLRVRPDLLLIDGNRFYAYQHTPHQCVVQGDGKYMSIAAASVLAKTYRDDYMLKSAKLYPQYDWHSNKGYPTKAHRMAIEVYGSTPLHRKTFKVSPVDVQLKFFKEG